MLVMLPGLMCDAGIFAAQTAAFPDTIAVDGFAETDRLDAMARRVLSLGIERMALLGHSMGARVALEVMRQAPERVERLALVSTGIHGVRDGEAGKRYALRDLGRHDGAQALIDAWLPPMVAPANRTPAIMAPLEAMCLRVGVEAFAAQTEALLHREEVEPLLPAIRCPTLVAVGKYDLWSPPAQHAAIAERLPNALLRVVPGAGHMLPAEAPDAFNAAIADWLARPVAA